MSLVVAGVFLAVAAGCSSAPIQKTSAPDWVLKGGGAFGGEKGKAFYGVGVSDKSASESTMREKADSRARADLAKVFGMYYKALVKDYKGSFATGEKSADEEAYESAMKQVFDISIAGIEIVDHWQNPDSKSLYALARLDVNAFKESAEKVSALSKDAKEHLKQNADRLHEELEKEVDKLKTEK